MWGLILLWWLRQGSLIAEETVTARYAHGNTYYAHNCRQQENEVEVGKYSTVNRSMKPERLHEQTFAYAACRSYIVKNESAGNCRTGR